MVRTEFRAVLCNDPYEIQLMQNLYDSAVKQLSLKFEILNNEFKVLYARNPIHHIEGRVKSVESLAAKLLNKGLPLTIEAAREHINDIAGVRVVCSYIDDVYRVAEMLELQRMSRSSKGKTISAHQTITDTAHYIWISGYRCICQTGRNW